MNYRMLSRLLSIVSAMLVLILLAPSTPAAAGGLSDTDGQVRAYLAAHPGGQPISANDISYGGGAFIVTVVRSSRAASPDCPAGWFCFYEHVNFGYPRGKLSDCGWQDLAPYGWRDRTESVHYNLLSGSVAFFNHGVSAQHTDDVRLFTVGTAQRTLANTGGNRNRADHVYRYC